jgi:SAM-dependent methyltransferase
LGVIPDRDDAFGWMLRDHLAGQGGEAVLEVEGGAARPALPAAVFFAPHEEWPSAEREALRQVSGRVLDIGCGAGRHALHLQEQGHDVLAIDVSPGAVEVARARGVRDVRLLPAEEIDQRLGRFDSFLMMCGNIGLVGSPEGGRRLLQRLARIATPRAVVIADCVEGPRVRLRLRYGDRVTPWFDWLNPAPSQLEDIGRAAGWWVEGLVRYDDEPEAYTAVLRRGGARPHA